VAEGDAVMKLINCQEALARRFSRLHPRFETPDAKEI
jgi:hypothetical protein